MLYYVIDYLFKNPDITLKSFFFEYSTYNKVLVYETIYIFIGIIGKN